MLTDVVYVATLLAFRMAPADIQAVQMISFAKFAAADSILLFGLRSEKHYAIDPRIEINEVRYEPQQQDVVAAVKAPSITLLGRVVTPGGKPVTAFTVAAGPGRLPSPWDSVRHEVRDRDGRFSMSLSKKGTTWVGVVADGFAPWEGSVDVQGGDQLLEVHLSPGVTVCGTVPVAKVLMRRVKAILFPRHDKSEFRWINSRPLAEQLGTRVASVSADGTFCFEHVRPDRYRLIVKGDGITRAAFALDVPGAGIDLGTVPFDFSTATGRLEGRVWRPKHQGSGVWAFAKGYVLPPQVGGDEGVDHSVDRFLNLPADAVEFQADQNGDFRLDGIPAGSVTVGFTYQVFDVIVEIEFSTRVFEGQTTVIHAGEPDGHRDLTLAFAIGDGSREQYVSGTGQYARCATNRTSK